MKIWSGNVRKILVIDDDRAVLNYLEVFFMQQGKFEAFCLEDSTRALEAVEDFQPDLILLDMDMPEVSGIEILMALAEKPEKPEVLILSGVEDVELAVKTIKLGAYDYLTKPIDEKKLLEAIAKPLEMRDLRRRVQNLENGGSDDPFAGFITGSNAMKKNLKYIEIIAPTDNPVLVWGESGTGKELIAKAIHKLSKRRDKPFISVNAGVFASELFASEFFGHTKGAFTGANADKKGFLEKANGGTLFLDEIGELSLPIQAKILRVLQEGEYYQVGSVQCRRVDVRLITATNKDLQKEIQSGNFRTDLFYRLNVCSVFVIPLRERNGDIRFLAQYFLLKYAKIHRNPIASISEEVMRLLERYHYPGNVRELENIVNTSVLIEDSKQLTRRALPQYFLDAVLKSRFHITNTHLKSISQVESEHIERVLEHTGGNRTTASKILDISRVTLISKIKKLKIDL